LLLGLPLLSSAVQSLLLSVRPAPPSKAELVAKPPVTPLAVLVDPELAPVKARDLVMHLHLGILLAPLLPQLPPLLPQLHRLLLQPHLAVRLEMALRLLHAWMT
jgi:hypothetical protein